MRFYDGAGFRDSVIASHKPIFMSTTQYSCGLQVDCTAGFSEAGGGVTQQNYRPITRWAFSLSAVARPADRKSEGRSFAR